MKSQKVRPNGKRDVVWSMWALIGCNGTPIGIYGLKRKAMAQKFYVEERVVRVKIRVPAI